MSYSRNLARLARDGILVVETAQSLRDLVNYGNQVPAVITLGALSKTDNGGGLWRWSPSSEVTDNLGTHLEPTGHVGPGRWVRDMNERVISPQMFGFSESATAEVNTTALNTALTVAAEAWSPTGTAEYPGGTVRLPQGTFYVNTINIPQGVNIIGSGMNATVLSGVGSGHTLKAVAGLYRQKFADFRVTHVQNTSNVGIGRALFISEYGVRFCLFGSLHLEGSTGISNGGLILHGIHPTLGLTPIIDGSSQGVWYNRIENCLIDSPYESQANLGMVGLGLYGAAVSNTLVNGNQIDRVSVQRVPYPFWLAHGHGNTFTTCKSDGEPTNLVCKFTIVGGKLIASTTVENVLLNCSWDTSTYPKALKLINENPDATGVFVTILVPRGLNPRPYVPGDPDSGAVELVDAAGGGLPRYSAWSERGILIDGASRGVTGQNTARLQHPQRDAWAGISGDPTQRSGMVMAGGSDFVEQTGDGADFLGSSGSLTLRIQEHPDAELRVVRTDGVTARKVLMVQQGEKDTFRFQLGTTLVQHIDKPLSLILPIPADNPVTLVNESIDVTDTRFAVSISAESGSTGTLTTISGGVRGQILVLAPALGHSITISNSDNIVRNDTTVLDSVNSRLILQRSEGEKWVELSRGITL